MLFMGLYNQALSDVRSTGGGIKCLYCSSVVMNISPIKKRNMFSERCFCKGDNINTSNAMATLSNAQGHNVLKTI